MSVTVHDVEWGDPRIVSGVDLQFATVLLAFVDMYEWVHRPWSPLSSRAAAIAEFGPDLEQNLDLSLSSFSRAAGRITAGCWIFHVAGSIDSVEGVGECVARDEPDGLAWSHRSPRCRQRVVGRWSSIFIATTRGCLA